MEEPYIRDPEELQEEEFELDPEEIAFWFRAKEWVWDINGELRTPTADEIYEVIHSLRQDVEATEGTNIYATLGRLLVCDDPDFPCSIDVYVYAGRISDFSGALVK